MSNAKPRKPKLLHQKYFQRLEIDGLNDENRLKVERFIMEKAKSYVKINIVERPDHTIAKDVKNIVVTVKSEGKLVNIGIEVSHWHSKILPIDFNLFKNDIQLYAASNVDNTDQVQTDLPQLQNDNTELLQRPNNIAQQENENAILTDQHDDSNSSQTSQLLDFAANEVLDHPRIDELEPQSISDRHNTDPTNHITHENLLEQIKIATNRRFQNSKTLPRIEEMHEEYDETNEEYDENTANKTNKKQNVRNSLGSTENTSLSADGVILLTLMSGLFLRSLF
jgi:hypothetical protein